MSKVRVNVATAVNKKSIRRERRNGRDVIVVPSATMPDDIVMNGILYEAAEIEKSYASLDQTPAPLGHPNIEGVFVSASHPEGMVRGFIGAWNENVRRENGRVFLDKIIDVEYAQQMAGGKAVLEAVEKGEPIHTSTGIYGVLHELEDHESGATHKMTDLLFDHDAILLGEVGAAQPEQGVGMFVNAQDPEGGQVRVINSALDRAEDDVDWAGMHLLDSLQRMERASKWEQIKASLLKMLAGNRETEEGERAMNEAQFKEVTDKLEAMSTTIQGLGDVIANALKPATDAMTAILNQQTAAEESKKADLVKQVVEAELLTEAVANTLDITALTELSKSIKPKTPGKVAGLNPVFNQAEGNVRAFALPKKEG